MVAGRVALGCEESVNKQVIVYAWLEKLRLHIERMSNTYSTCKPSPYIYILIHIKTWLHLWSLPYAADIIIPECIGSPQRSAYIVH